MSRGEIFLNLYRELEEVLSAENGGSRPGLIQDFAYNEGYRYREDLLLFREIRNLLSHHGEIDGEDAVIASEAAVNRLREVLEFAKNPPAAMNAAIPVNELYTASLSDKVSEVIENMESRGFSHVPIINAGGVLTGVFSVGTLFTFARRRKGQAPAELRLAELEELLRADRHTTEQFAFVSTDAPCSQIKKLFRSEGPGVRRVAAVFVTSDGTERGRLLGMITPWDILRTEKT